MTRDDNHPRPQLTRERWTDLCGVWRFAFDDEDVGRAGGWIERPTAFDREIDVPFPPESRASGLGETGYHPIVWYRRTFRLGAGEAADRLLLHFGAVDYRAEVWVNGRFVVRHEGGHTPFSADVSDVLGRDDTEQVIVVRVEDDPGDLTQPRGKQDWEPTPHRIWYHRTTGIWQPVWLEPVPTARIDQIRWLPDLDSGLLGLTLRLNTAPPRPLALRLRLWRRGELLTDDRWLFDQVETRRQVALDLGQVAMSRDELLWSPRYPNLLDAEVTLLDGDEVVDRVGSYVGLRSCGVGGGRFQLNGRPYYPRLVLAQNYWPETHLAAPSIGALRREAGLVKELGFNGVRIHQKVEDPRFLAECDRLGLLVWGEMANAYVFSATAIERLTREWLEVVRRDANHPSLVTWMPINESWGVPNLPRDRAQRDYVRGLYHLTKALDPSRPVIGNDGWEHLASDIWGIHDYALDGETLRRRYGTSETLERTITEVQPAYRSVALPEAKRAGEPVMLTEFGGISHSPAAGERWHGYGTVSTTEAFLATYRDVVDAVLDSPAIAGFCYTQLTDTEQETNGLLSADRVPKLDIAAVRQITSRPSPSMPGDLVAEAQEAVAAGFSGGSG